jgi:tripartite ATP-independent transporter DctM subunit
MLIPPSLLLILYAVLSERSVGALFIAGILPGILLAVAYAVAILFMAYRMPNFVGETVAVSQAPLSPGEVLAKILPIIVLITLVLGGIYGGFFTPTEAGAVGALGATLVAFAKRRLSLKTLWKITIETGHITASICFLIIAASMYGRMLAVSGVPNFVGSWVVQADLGLYGFLALYVLIAILMGTILDSSSIMLILVPLVLPITQPLGIDLIWFGIITVIAIEIGLLTPPLGLSVYVIKGTLDDQSISLNSIFAGAAPFALVMLLVLILIIAFPWLSLALL